MCRRYLPSSLSTPCAAPANFSQLPLPAEKERHTLATLCGIEVSPHLYENKLFFRVRRMRELHYNTAGEGGGLFLLRTLISYRGENRAGDCLSQGRRSCERKLFCGFSVSLESLTQLTPLQHVIQCLSLKTILGKYISVV